MDRYAILCVDDEEIVLTALESLLEDSFGNICDIELAQSAEDGLEIIKEFIQSGIDLVIIISDWLMPNMKGDEFLIKVHEISPNVEKIMLSGHADEKSVQNAKDKQALDFFISKPWDSNELVKLVSKKLEEYGYDMSHLNK